MRSAGNARLVGAGRDSGGEPSAVCVIVVSAFEPPPIVAGLDDVTVMDQPVEQRGGSSRTRGLALMSQTNSEVARFLPQ